MGGSVQGRPRLAPKGMASKAVSSPCDAFQKYFVLLSLWLMLLIMFDLPFAPVPQGQVTLSIFFGISYMLLLLSSKGALRQACPGGSLAERMVKFRCFGPQLRALVFLWLAPCVIGGAGDLWYQRDE